MLSFLINLRRVSFGLSNGGQNLFHTNFSAAARRGSAAATGPESDREMQQLLKRMKLSDEDLTTMQEHQHIEDDVNTNVEGGMDYHFNAAAGNVELNRKKLTSQIIEQKYFKDLYKIKPGEKYSRKKDPYFKKVKSTKDFVHPHHYSMKVHEMSRQLYSEAKRNRRRVTAAELSTKPSHLDMSQFGHQQHPDNHTTQTSYQSSSHKKLSSTEAYATLTSSQIVDSNSNEFDNESNSNVASKTPERYMNALSNDGRNNKSRPGSVLEDEDHLADFSSYNGQSLLLWSMKEQMRYLHTTDPDLWTPQMLASIFPLNSKNAKLVVKSNWVPEDEAAIARHDRRALDNWKRLPGGRSFVNANIVRKSIADRLDRLVMMSSSVPVPVPTKEQMFGILDKLKFEEPESAIRMGIKPEERRSRNTDPGGQFANIIRDYNQQLDNLSNNNKDNSESRDLLPTTHEGNVVKINSIGNSQNSDNINTSIPTNALHYNEHQEITYAEYCKRQNESSSNENSNYKKELGYIGQTKKYQNENVQISNKVAGSLSVKNTKRKYFS